MNGDDYYIGRVAISRAGRDAGRAFLIVERVDENYVGIVDGTLRKLERPKKKKLKHLELSDVVADNIKVKLLEGSRVFDAQIRKYLLTAGFNHEKISEEE